MAYASPVSVTYPRLTGIVAWKYKKDIKYLGSAHGGELSEFYGVSQDVTDKVTLDSVCELGSENPGQYFY